MDEANTLNYRTITM